MGDKFVCCVSNDNITCVMMTPEFLKNAKQEELKTRFLNQTSLVSLKCLKLDLF